MKESSLLQVRQAGEDDLPRLLRLYMHLHNNPMPEINDGLEQLYKDIINDPRHFILLGWVGGEVVSSCVLVVILNLTQGQRPYALIENVVTAEAHRGRGYATALLEKAVGLAAGKGCYKVMLMTGSKKESTLEFYERAGFNRNDKKAFIRWL